MIDKIVPLTSIELSGKILILRVDFNCPVSTANHVPVLLDTKRIDDHIDETIQPLLGAKNRPRKIIILAHQGRKGHDDYTNLRPHFEYFRNKLQNSNYKIRYISEDLSDRKIFDLGDKAVSSPEILEKINSVKNDTILFLENVRFDRAEEDLHGQTPRDFVGHPLIAMLSHIENRVVALDGFSVAHRSQPSVTGLANLGPLYAGPVVMRELTALSKALIKPKTPMILVIGGAKVDDSLNCIERFLSDGRASKVLTGGIVGLVLLLSRFEKFNIPTMNNISNSVDNLEETLKHAQELILRFGSDKIKVPIDLAFGPPQGFADSRKTSTLLNLSKSNKKYSRYSIGDIGVRTVGYYIQEISMARTVVANGTMGRYEWACFNAGTHQILYYMSMLAHDTDALVLVGGGDTGAAIGQVPAEYTKKVSQCSSGKAFLEVLSSGRIGSLSGIQALARIEKPEKSILAKDRPIKLASSA